VTSPVTPGDAEALGLDDAVGPVDEVAVSLLLPDPHAVRRRAAEAMASTVGERREVTWRLR
jgi:hypothetical protein